MWKPYEILIFIIVAYWENLLWEIGQFLQTLSIAGNSFEYQAETKQKSLLFLNILVYFTSNLSHDKNIFLLSLKYSQIDSKSIQNDKKSKAKQLLSRFC